MVDADISLYVTEKEYNNNGYHAASIVRDGLQESFDYYNNNHSNSISYDIHVPLVGGYDVGGEDADCDAGNFDTWRDMLNNNNVSGTSPDSNLLISHRGYWDDANGDGCAAQTGWAAMVEGGKAFDNIDSIDDLNRYNSGTNRAHRYLCLAMMEIGHNFGGGHGGTWNHHGRETYGDGAYCWSPIISGYGNLEDTYNECGVYVDHCYCGDKDRYYSDCMHEEILG